MMVCIDARLIHPGDESGPERGADGGSGVGTGKNDTFPGEAINVGGGNRFFALIPEMTGHVIDKNPNDIRLFLLLD